MSELAAAEEQPRPGEAERSSKTRVMLVEDDFDQRSFLVESLNACADWVVVGAFSMGEDAMAALEAGLPDVMLVDLALPDMSGIDLIRRAAARHPGLPCVALTIFEDEDHIVSAIGAGACGYLLKTDLGGHWVDTLRAALRGEPPISPRVARKMLDILRRESDKSRPRQRHASSGSARSGVRTAINAASVPGDAPLYLEPLSQRELEVLQGVAEGRSLVHIAQQTSRSYHTVRTQVKNIYRKLNAHTLQEAVHVARRTGQIAD